jgi:hypothetical protein
MKFRSLAVLALSALSLLSCTTAQCERPGATAPPAGLARFYFFRSASVYDSQQWTAVSLNRQKVGDSAPGSVFYRDVPPGRYQIEVRSDKLYPNQFRTVVVAPGSTTYVAVQNLPNWGQSGWQTQGTTFTVSIVDPTLAVPEIAALCPTRG